MTTVYRVENAEGEGPFVDSRVYTRHLMHCNNTDKYPSAWQDFDGVPEEMLYAVHRLPLVRSWFPAKTRKILARLGYVLKVYEAQHVEIGRSKKQARFDPSFATCIDTLPLEAL